MYKGCTPSPNHSRAVTPLAASNGTGPSASRSLVTGVGGHLCVANLG